MTIRHIHTFVVVYEHMNITHAANALHMTQPAVSRMIRELESYYNVQFFDRINRRLHPTDAGRQLYEHANQIIEHFNNMECHIRDLNDAFTINIGATFSLGSVLLPLAIERIKNTYPKATVRGHVYNAGNLTAFLEKGSMDFAMIEDSPDDPALNSEVFFEDKMVLVLPADHPLTHKPTVLMADLPQYPLLVRELESFGRKRVEETFAQHGLTLNPLLESCSTRAIIQSVRCNLGIAMLPWYLVKDDLQSGAVATRPIADEPLYRSNYLVWHKDKVRSASMLKAMSICRCLAYEFQQSAESIIGASRCQSNAE